MAEHLEKLDPKTRYRKPSKKTKEKRNVSSGAAAAVDRCRSKSGKCFRRGDTNRQLENVIKKQELADTKTWVEVNGKMVLVSTSALRKNNEIHNEPIKEKKLEDQFKKLGAPVSDWMKSRKKKKK